MGATGEIVVLGCGSSAGTPVVGCDCAVCTSAEPRNRRTRCSAYLSAGDARLLIDTSPDLRAQALREDISRVDGVLYTHPHADHLNGIDDLRAFCYVRRGPIDLYGNTFTLANIRERFGYSLMPPSPVWDKPVLVPHEVGGPFTLGGARVTPIQLKHGGWPCLGWRVGRMAWLTDVSSIPDDSLALLDGLELLFLDCLRDDPYPSHLSVAESLDWAARIGARRTVLIHMVHSLDYHALAARCPDGVEPAYDGMRLTFSL